MVSNGPAILWLPKMPSAASLVAMLRLAKAGNTSIKWFSQITPKKVKPSLAKLLATFFIIFTGRRFGAAYPRPEYVGLDNSYKVSEYISEV